MSTHSRLTSSPEIPDSNSATRYCFQFFCRKRTRITFVLLTLAQLIPKEIGTPFQRRVLQPSTAASRCHARGARCVATACTHGAHRTRSCHSANEVTAQDHIIASYDPPGLMLSNDFKAWEAMDSLLLLKLSRFLVRIFFSSLSYTCLPSFETMSTVLRHFYFCKFSSNHLPKSCKMLFSHW